MNVCSGVVGNHCARTWYLDFGLHLWICQVTSPQRIRPIFRNGSISRLCNRAIWFTSTLPTTREATIELICIYRFHGIVILTYILNFVCTICGRSRTQTWYATWANQPKGSKRRILCGCRSCTSPKGVGERVSFLMLIDLASCQRHALNDAELSTVCGQAENVTIFRVHWWVEFAEESRLAKWFYHFFQEWRKECDDMFKTGAILMGAIFWISAGRKNHRFLRSKWSWKPRPFGVLGQLKLCHNVVVSLRSWCLS